MSDHTGDLQAAVFAVLKANNAICNGRIYDDVPATVGALASDFPYVEIGETQAVADDTDTFAGTTDDGIVGYVTLHVWSRQRGKAETHAINQQIRTALHGTSLTVTGRESALAWIDSMLVMNDPDGVTRHGVITLRVVHRS